MKKHFIEVKKFDWFCHILFCFVSYISVLNIVRTYETLLTYDFRIRNTDPLFHLLLCYVKN